MTIDEKKEQSLQAFLHGALTQLDDRAADELLGIGFADSVFRAFR
jgi:hypothetical protein